MLKVITSQQPKITHIQEEESANCRKKLIHPRVLKAIELGRPKSPFLLIRDAHQPLNGDLRKKCPCNL